MDPQGCGYLVGPRRCVHPSFFESHHLLKVPSNSNKAFRALKEGVSIVNIND